MSGYVWFFFLVVHVYLFLHGWVRGVNEKRGEREAERERERERERGKANWKGDDFYYIVLGLHRMRNE